MFYLYKIENIINGNLYIGKTINPTQRKYKHFTNADNIHLRNSINKYGKKSFTFEIFESYESEDEAYQAELYWISYLREQGAVLYNISDGGKGGSSGIKQTPEQIEKRISGLRGRIVSEETRLKISESKRGISLTEETKQKISKTKTGKLLSEETKNKMSESRKGEKNHNFGKTLSEETKKKLSEARNNQAPPMKNKTHSENAKKKMSDSKKKLTNDQELNVKNDTRKYQQIADDYNISISMVCRLKKKTN